MDYPSSITKQLPWSIEKGLPYYEQHLANCGYNEKLTYQQGKNNGNKKKNLGKIENAILYGLTHRTANR